MNAIYKVIFNRATGQPVVVSELGKGKQKRSTCKYPVYVHGDGTSFVNNGLYSINARSGYDSKSGIAQWSSDGENRYHLGVMAGYANQKSNARNHVNGNRADGSISGYSAGLYGTWLQDNEAKTGAWVLYNWLDITVSGKSAGSESNKSKGFTASVEGGYTLILGERDERTAYYIQPKAQAIRAGFMRGLPATTVS